VSETQESVRTVRLTNPAGLHARPCHAIVTAASGFQSELFVGCEDSEVNGRSILELMTLCAPCHATLRLRARGRDAEALLDRLEALVEAGFGELD